MYFDSFSELWAMAGHGPYVWSAYAISAVVLVGSIVLPIRRYRSQLKQLQSHAYHSGGEAS